MQTAFSLFEDDLDASGICDCCGHTTHTAFGWAECDGKLLAAYAVRWTPGHVIDQGAIFDFLWWNQQPGAAETDRYIVTLDYRVNEAGGPGYMVIDAATRRGVFDREAGEPLRRDQVIGTEIARDTFALVDAIFLGDTRIAEMNGHAPTGP